MIKTSKFIIVAYFKDRGRFYVSFPEQFGNEVVLANSIPVKGLIEFKELYHAFVKYHNAMYNGILLKTVCELTIVAL